MPLNFTAPLMPPWPLTPITGNKVYSSPNQAMHQGDRLQAPLTPLTPLTETATNRVEGGGGSFRSKGGKNRSGAKKPNNGHPKKEMGVANFMFWFEPGGMGWDFFLCLAGQRRGEGVKSKLYWGNKPTHH